MLIIQVFEGDVKVGTLTTEQFRKSAKASSTAFLSDIVAQFNEFREQSGDQTRVKLALDKKEKT
jgi:hypothetical protein